MGLSLGQYACASAQISCFSLSYIYQCPWKRLRLVLHIPELIFLYSYFPFIMIVDIVLLIWQVAVEFIVVHIL
jgi:hypothetical protein